MQADPIGVGVSSDVLTREGCSCQIEANRNGASCSFQWLRHDNITNRTALRAWLGRLNGFLGRVLAKRAGDVPCEFLPYHLDGRIEAYHGYNG